MKKNILILTSIILPFIFISSAECQNIVYRPGEGLHMVSKLNDWDLFLSGYIQSIFSYRSANMNNAVQNSFGVHRARLDLGFDYEKNYDMFFEFDAAGQRTEMVLAQLDATIWGSNKIRAGKFINPFSPENNRSTSRLTTIERYSGLNSVFLLPGLDSQYGVMFFGSMPVLDYYFSITNGNGAAGQNIPENNNSKDITGRLEYTAAKDLRFGGSLEFTTEASQKLSIVDHVFESFNTVDVSGKRFGYLAYFSIDIHPYLFRGEAFRYNFNNALSLNNETKNFTGGYFELGYFFYGGKSNGLQAIARFETAHYGKMLTSITGPTALNSYLAGINWLAHNIFSFQANLIYEDADKQSVLPSSALAGKSGELVLLTTFQLRF